MKTIIQSLRTETSDPCARMAHQMRVASCIGLVLLLAGWCCTRPDPRLGARLGVPADVLGGHGAAADVVRLCPPQAAPQPLLARVVRCL